MNDIEVLAQAIQSTASKAITVRGELLPTYSNLYILHCRTGCEFLCLNSNLPDSVPSPDDRALAHYCTFRNLGYWFLS